MLILPNEIMALLTQVQHPTGLTTTYGPYNAYSGSYPGYLAAISDSPLGRSQTFTWQNGWVRTHTDARGLLRTLTRDGLGRLTQIDYPAHDGIAASSIQYSYSLAHGQGFNNSGSAIPILHRTAVKDRRDLKELPEEDRGRYNTLAGMIMLLLGRLPRTADTVVWEDWRFEVVDLDGKRVDKVLATRTEQPGEKP